MAQNFKRCIQSAISSTNIYTKWHTYIQNETTSIQVMQNAVVILGVLVNLAYCSGLYLQKSHNIYFPKTSIKILNGSEFAKVNWNT